MHAAAVTTRRCAMAVLAPTRESPPTPWHALPIADVARRLDSDPVLGVSPGEAERRLAADGPNALAEPAAVPWWRTFLAQFRELVIWILIAAAVIAGAMGDWADTAAIVAIVLVNAVIGFLQENRAPRALAALRTMTAPMACVVRAGRRLSIPSREVVLAADPGPDWPLVLALAAIPLALIEGGKVVRPCSRRG